jgi:5'-deoxynucleotidase YfbR-like HD superfamily hydrolase
MDWRYVGAEGISSSAPDRPKSGAISHSQLTGRDLRTTRSGARPTRMLTSAECVIGVLEALSPAFDVRSSPRADDIGADVDAMIDAFRLQTVRRYFHQVHWSDETNAALRADAIEPGLKLENVAAHSWHVADAVLLLSDRFEHLSSERALRLAILHDKLEMYTGDFDPVGTDGKGNHTHAFDPSAQARKTVLERQALAEYLKGLRPSAREAQRALIEENLLASTREARFVKAVVKLQALAFIHEKKNGSISDEHLIFDWNSPGTGVACRY